MDIESCDHCGSENQVALVHLGAYFVRCGECGATNLSTSLIFLEHSDIPYRMRLVESESNSICAEGRWEEIFPELTRLAGEGLWIRIERQPARTVEEALIQLEEEGNIEELITLAIDNEISVSGQEDSSGAAMAIVLDAVLSKGYEPDGFVAANGFKVYRYVKANRQNDESFG